MKTTVKPKRIPMALTFWEIIITPRIMPRIPSLKKLKTMSFIVGLCVPVIPMTVFARPLRFMSPRIPPIRIPNGSFGKLLSIKEKKIVTGIRIMIDCL